VGFFDRLSEIASGAREPEGPSREDELAQARVFWESGQREEARRKLEELAARDARDTSALMLLGTLLRDGGAAEEAALAFGRAADRAPTFAEAWCRLGEVLASRGRFEPARDALRRCLALEPSAPLAFVAHAALGRLYLTHAQPQRALRELSLALEHGERLVPPRTDDAPLLADRGRAALASGDPGGADWLVRAARVAGNEAPGARLAWLLEAARAKADSAEAETLLREAAGEEERAFALTSPVAVPGPASDPPGTAPGTGDGRGEPASEVTKRPPPESGETGPRIEARVALIRHLAAQGASEALVRAQGLLDSFPSTAAAPPLAFEALATAAAANGRYQMAFAASDEAARRGHPLPFDVRVVFALGSGQRQVLADVASSSISSAGSLGALVNAWLAGTSSAEDDLALAALAPTEEGRRMVLGARALPPLPGVHVVALLNRAQELTTHVPALAALATVAAHARDAFDRPLCVAVMGEFNAGKSSFVNALVGADIAPVGVTPTTATLNVFRHGPPSGRAIFLDGRVEDIPGRDLPGFLREIADEVTPRSEEAGDGRASELARTEIFAPVDVLRAVEIVDTPGLNALRPAHERLARAFLEEADALIWLFAVDQAAKASERDVLASAHAARKKILGVVSKADRADEVELASVVRHIASNLGPWLEALVPVSAKRARKAQAQTAGGGVSSPLPDDARFAAEGASPELEASGLPALMRALETAFLSRARLLKTTSALTALDRFAQDAAMRLAATRAALPASARVDEESAALERFAEAWQGALAAERVTLRGRLDEIWRNGALELATLIEPRAWALGENKARAADEAFLDETLEEGLARALGAVARALEAVEVSRAATATPPASVAECAGLRLREDARSLVREHLARFEAYARGVRETGLAAFFRHELPRLRPQAAAFRGALARTVPDVEGALFLPLGRAFAAALARRRSELAEEAARARLLRLAFAVTADEPFEEFRRVLQNEIGKLQAGDENAVSA
jgi:tetratricopeptide (TPR) repeat protein/GTP-binding protein EngB required for normal cell division